MPWADKTSVTPEEKTNVSEESLCCSAVEWSKSRRTVSSYCYLQLRPGHPRTLSSMYTGRLMSTMIPLPFGTCSRCPDCLSSCRRMTIQTASRLPSAGCAACWRAPEERFTAWADSAILVIAPGDGQQPRRITQRRGPLHVQLGRVFADHAEAQAFIKRLRPDCVSRPIGTRACSRPARRAAYP